MLQQLLVLVERGDVAKRAHGSFGGAEAGNGGVVQDAAPGDDRSVTHPAGKQGFANRLFDIGQRLRHLGGIDAGLGRINGQNSVDTTVMARSLNGHAVVLRSGVFRDINQIRQGGLFGQQWLEGRRAGGRQFAQLQMNFVDPVRSEHTRPAPVGNDSQPLAHRPVARGEAFGCREQFHKRAHPHCAGAAQRSVKHIVAADDGPAVGLCGFVACRLSACLEHDHRFGIGRHAQGAHETARIGNTFEVHHDAVCLRVVGQEIEHLCNVHTGVRPQGDHGRESHGVVGGPVQHAGGQRTRL